jgi:putative addiction module killer protein
VEAKKKLIAIYETEDGQRPFKRWIDSLKDKVTKARINARILRVENGNFGNSKALGAGVSELKIDFGPGFRVYYGLDGDKVVVLLIGGDKSTQDKDIRLAQDYWADYLRRTQHEKSE